MRTRILLFASAVGLLLVVPRPGRAGDGDSILNDELTVKSAGLPLDGPGLLEFFRLRTKGEVAPDHLAALIERLGSNDGTAREKAAAELTAIGPPAVPALRAAAKDPDSAESAGLARRCLAALQENSVNVSAAAVRLIAQRKPDGATAALLAYLPYTEDASLQEEVKAALTGMAYHDGKADPALLAALADESPLRRGMAVDVLCQNGLAEPRDVLRKLLNDPKPTVQLRAALALAQARDATAMDTLIDLLAKLPVGQGRYAEEYLASLAGDQAPKEGLTDDASRGKVHDAWAGWWKSTEGTASLEEFRKRTLTELDREKADKLIRQLGDDSFDVRQKAKMELKDMGVVVIRMLRAVANDEDKEVQQNARSVLADIDRDKAAPLAPVAARVVALRKPPGAADALLAYLPFCDDEGMVPEVQAALNAVAYPDGKPAPVVVKALEDKAPARRGAAAEALCVGPLGDNLPAVKKLLADDDRSVRLQAALALAGGPRDRDAVPVLIALIADAKLTPDQAAQAEEYLLRTAAEHGPVNLPEGDAGRAKRSEMWAAWWKDNGERVALADRYVPSTAPRYLGYTLLIQPNNSQIIELGPDGKTRLTLAGLSNPQDAVGLPGDHFLVTEFGAQRVTERNAKNDVLWTKSTPGFFPQSAQRLPNGNTFIVCRNQLIECTRDGKDVYVIPRPNNDILSAAKLRNNEIVIVSALSFVERIDAKGGTVKKWNMPQQTWTLGNDVLPNGNVLITFQAPFNRVAEFDPDGKEVFSSTSAINPIASARSPNGNTLMVSQQWPNHLVEVDRNNKPVNDWTLPMNTTTNRVRRW